MEDNGGCRSKAPSGTNLVHVVMKVDVLLLSPRASGGAVAGHMESYLYHLAHVSLKHLIQSIMDVLINAKYKRLFLNFNYITYYTSVCASLVFVTGLQCCY